MIIHNDRQVTIEKNTTGPTIIFSAFKNITFTGVSKYSFNIF